MRGKLEKHLQDNVVHVETFGITTVHDLLLWR